MTGFRLRTSAAYAIIGLMMGLAVQGMFLSSLWGAPVSHVIPAMEYRLSVRPGGMVRVDFTAEKDRECITQTTRWLWRDIQGRREIMELSYGAMSFGHDLPNDPRDYRFVFEVPRWMPDGEWNVRTLHADYCWPWSWMLGPRLRTSPAIGIRIAGQ